MKDLITQDYKFIMTSMSFNDSHKGQTGQYDFNIIFETSGYAVYFSKELNSLRFDVDIAMVSTINNQVVGFTLNACARIIFQIKKNIKQKEIEVLVNQENEETMNRINETLRPIILKEIEYILKNTFYKKIELSGLA